MAKKTNPHAQEISAMTGSLKFGGIVGTAGGGDVTSAAELKGCDGRHFIELAKDGVRKGWTTMNAPGAFQINAGEDLKQSDHGIFINSENGDIIIRARNGKVRIEGLDVDISATGADKNGFLSVYANQGVKVDSNNITLNAKQALKLLSTGVLTLDGKFGMQILSPMINGASGATNNRQKPAQINKC